MKPLCIYHGNCADGFAAAWAVWKALCGGMLDDKIPVEFVAGVYQETPPDVRNRDVIVVDFSYKREVMAKIAKQARSLIILDHHKTAIEDLDGLLPDAAIDLGYDLVTKAQLKTGIFKLQRSGAGITWDFFHPGKAPPKLVQYVEDYDLHLHQLTSTRAINCTIKSTPYSFAAWEQLYWDLQDAAKVQRMIAGGDAIDRKLKKDVDELLAATKRRLVIGGINVPACNLPYTMATEAGNLMAKSEAFAAVYWETGGHRIFSLRSAAPDGHDVAAIAQKYGGGGHKHAAGFRVPLGKLGELA